MSHYKREQKKTKKKTNKKQKKQKNKEKNKNKRSKLLIPVLEEVIKILGIIFESHQ